MCELNGVIFYSKIVLKSKSFIIFSRIILIVEAVDGIGDIETFPSPYFFALLVTSG